MLSANPTIRLPLSEACLFLGAGTNQTVALQGRIEDPDEPDLRAETAFRIIAHPRPSRIEIEIQSGRLGEDQWYTDMERGDRL
jgi:hypothetical protein